MTSTSQKTPFFYITILFLFQTYLSSFSNADCNASVSGCKQSSNFVSSVHSTIEASLQAISAINSHGVVPTNDYDEFDLSSALHDCTELLDDSIDHLRASIDDPNALKCKGSSSPCTSISTALTNQELCIEGLDIKTDNTTIKQKVVQAVEPLNSMMTQLLKMVEPKPIQFDHMKVNKESIPWLKKFDMETSKANVTVALDGSGHYRKIMDAVNAAPDKSNHRFVIRIKAGVYNEYVKISKHKQNLVMIGEGQDKTIITGNRSYASGFKTYHTSTFVVSGCGFMASHITFENTAGPKGSQAVALRSNADNMVFYRCTFSGYQDTLYARSGRQFFRECDIKGTVDFIFGDATAVFQHCSILVRMPIKGQSNTITAQGRAVACSDSGFSFQDCKFIAAEEISKETRTYLGRPWRNHSRTVVMKSFIGDLVHKEGWLDWAGRSSLDTIYYGEYKNSGYGANVSERAKWPGFHAIEDDKEAENFTVGKFIDGDQWLPSTGVYYTSGFDQIDIHA